MDITIIISKKIKIMVHIKFKVCRKKSQKKNKI